MDDLVLMLQGAMAAEGKVGLMMNVPQGGPASRCCAVLPALQNADRSRRWPTRSGWP